MSDLGYAKPLYILPFDHRATVAQKLFGLKSAENLTEEQIHFMRDFKMLVYKGFKKALEKGIPTEYGAILCDEDFGSEVLFDAKHNGFVTLLTIEKSGTELLEFQYEDYEAHILNFKPTFTKLLVKYNPEDSQERKLKQKEKMKIISDFSHKNNLKFLLEVLVVPTEKQLEEAGTKEDYDLRLRPSLSIEVIKDMQNFGIEPDVWKLEGFESELEYQQIVSTIRQGGRDNVSLVILGRGADNAKVADWLRAGVKVDGVTGFAVGRTIFWEVVEKFYKGQVGKAEVIDTVAENFYKFYKVFTS